jgi:small subunit ribosomal protein S3Ae
MTPVALAAVTELARFFSCEMLTLIFSESAADSLKGRVFEMSLGDLNQNAHEQSWRKVRVQCEEVKAYDCYTNYYGMDITRDKMCTLVKKWHTTIEAFAQAKTSDGYHLRMFCIAFTRRNKR